MEKAYLTKILQMQFTHLQEVCEIAQKNRLSYWSLEDYKSEITRNDSYCAVVEDRDNKVAGFLVARLIMAKSCAELHNIAVRDNFKRKGIGELLLSSLTKQCIINNLDQINLEVRESNKTAIKFYLKLNFQTIETRKNFYSNPSENAITMIKFLNK